MSKSDTWPGGVAMETVISKDSAGSYDSVISMDSNHSDDSLMYFAPDVRASLMFLEETIESLELEEDSGLSNDELDPHTPTPTHTDKVTICLPTHTRMEDVSRCHDDPNQVMGKNHKPSMSYMVPTPLLLANGPSLLRSRLPSSSAADHKPTPTPTPPTTGTAVAKHAGPEAVAMDKLITVPAAVSTSGHSAAADPVEIDISKVMPAGLEVTSTKLITDALEMPTDKAVDSPELIGDERTTDAAGRPVSTHTSDPDQLISANLAGGPTTHQMPVEVPTDTTLTTTPACASAVGISEDATSATPVEDAPKAPQVAGVTPPGGGMEFIPPPMAFMDEPAEDSDSEMPVPSDINLADIPAPAVPAEDAPNPAFPASDIPAPVIPSPDVLTQDANDASFSASDIRPPVMSSPDVPARVTFDAMLPDIVIPPPEIATPNSPDPPDNPIPVIPSPDIPALVIPTIDIPAPYPPSAVPPSQTPPNESETANGAAGGAGGVESVGPASQRGPLSYSELEKLRKKASMKKAPGSVPVVHIRRPASPAHPAPAQSSPTAEGLPRPPQEYCDAKSPPTVAPKPKKLPSNIALNPHRLADPVSGPLISPDRVLMDPQKVHMEALRKLGLLKGDEPDSRAASGHSLSPRSRRSWAPPSGPPSSPGPSSARPPTPEVTAQPALPSLRPPAADTPSPKLSPAPQRKTVQVRLAPRQVPSGSDEGGQGVAETPVGGNEDEQDDLDLPDHLPPSPPAAHTHTHTHTSPNSSAPRPHGISVQISPLSNEEDRREALRKLGLLKD
ncbi:specifically androgen-regulated gene protein isoform X2 [Alosa sapidissima]|uniref:specifically androgen-regulated gene protein isoform X2 n=1 Tax=Alosa sapidissima TaxID=34773 RepID=UPI001C099AE5|nr:specifically androgen-regulated gene protein isoform X2 [Alosa sapidissima]